MFQTEKAHLLFFVGAALMFKVQFLQEAGCHQQWICAIITHLTKWWQACWSPPWSSCRRPCSSPAGRTPWLPSPKLPSAQVSWDWYMIWYGSMMAVMAVFRCQLVVQRWQNGKGWWLYLWTSTLARDCCVIALQSYICQTTPKHHFKESKIFQLSSLSSYLIVAPPLPMIAPTMSEATRSLKGKSTDRPRPPRGRGPCTSWSGWWLLFGARWSWRLRNGLSKQMRPASSKDDGVKACWLQEWCFSCINWTEFAAL